MRRREFIGLISGAAAWPLKAVAEQTERVRRIGFLLGLTENDPEARTRIAAFREGLEATDGRKHATSESIIGSRAAIPSVSARMLKS
jgi:hypothetical protein